MQVFLASFSGNRWTAVSRLAPRSTMCNRAISISFSALGHAPPPVGQSRCGTVTFPHITTLAMGIMPAFIPVAILRVTGVRHSSSTGTFANGWSLGAFATKTNISSRQFGEGSFDKGIRFSIPLSWLVSRPTKQAVGMTIRPLTRDGGQRVNVSGRLYDGIAGAHKPGVVESWGKYWR